MAPSTKNYLLGFLVLTTLAGAGMAVSQHFELQDLKKQSRVNVTQVAPAKNTAAKAYLANTSGGNAQPAADTQPEDTPPTMDNEGGPGGLGGPGGPGGPGNFRGGRGRGNWGAQMATLMKNPEFAAAMRVQQRAELDRRYGNLFKQLGLPADKLGQLKNLMAERQNAMMDVMSTASAQGLNPRENREEIHQLTQAMQAEVDASIRSTIGDAAYAQYENYNATQSQRTAVNRINDTLSYTSTPLSTAQSQQLVAIMANNGTREVTDQVISQARGILSNDQIAALQQYQAEQQARAKVSQMMRSSSNRQNQQRQNRN